MENYNDELEHKDVKPVYPINIDKCPVCGSSLRVTQKIVDDNHYNMGIKEGEPIGTLTITPLAGASKIITSLLIPCIMRWYDDCAVCFTHYAFRIDVKSFRPEELGLTQQPNMRRRN
jgi:hypothetical protein